MKKFMAVGLLLSFCLFGIWPGTPSLAAMETQFRQVSGGESPQTQRKVQAGLEEAQLAALAGRWFEGNLELARRAVESQAKALGLPLNEILFPIVSQPSGWWSPDLIDHYWRIQAPPFGTAGGGGTVTVQVPTVDLIKRIKGRARFATVAVDDSGGDSGKRRRWTVIAVGDWRNGLVNQLSETLKDFLSARLSTDYGLQANPPETVGGVTLQAPFSFRGALKELAFSSAYQNRVTQDPNGLWVLTNLDLLMAVLDWVILNQTDALKEFPELETRIQQYQKEGRIGAPEAYQEYPIVKAALGNLLVHAGLLTTGATIEPEEAKSKRRELDPQRVKQAEWLLEQALGVKGHVVLASTVVTDRYGVFARELPRSLPNKKSEVLIGRLRLLNDVYDPVASDEDKKHRQVFTIRRDPQGNLILTYLDDSLNPTDSPRWPIDLNQIPVLDQGWIQGLASGQRLVLQGTALPTERIWQVGLDPDGKVVYRPLEGTGDWGDPKGQFQLKDQDGTIQEDTIPEGALAHRIRPRIAELKDVAPVVTLILGEDQYSEQDTWHGTDLLRHSVSERGPQESWILYAGHVGEADATPEAISLIDNIPAGGIYVIGPGSDGTSLLAVHDKRGIWKALRRAVERKVKVIMVMGISYDTDTHSRTYREQLADWELAYQIGTNDSNARLSQVITHVAINRLAGWNRQKESDQLQAFVQREELQEGLGPVSGLLSKAAQVVAFGSELEAIQALSGVYRLALLGDPDSTIPTELKKKREGKARQVLGNEVVDSYLENLQAPLWKVFARQLLNFVRDPAIENRVYLLTDRMAGMAESAKFRGGREPMAEELLDMEAQFGIEVIYEPLTVVNTELRSDRGNTKPETNARSDRQGLAKAYEPLITLAAGMEEMPPLGDKPTLTLSDFGKLLKGQVQRVDFNQIPDMAKDGIPFVLVGTKTDAQNRPGLAYGMALAQIGFPVGFVVEDLEREQVLQDFSAQSGVIQPWQIARIDNVTILTVEDAIEILNSRARENGVSFGEPIELGVRLPIAEPLLKWLEDLNVRLPAEVARTAEWLISEAAKIFA